VPNSIGPGLFDLSALAFIGMASIGYQAGLAVTRRSPAMLLLVLAFAGVLFLIADLDRGLEGFLTVNQEAMTDLQRSIHSAQQEAGTSILYPFGKRARSPDGNVLEWLDAVAETRQVLRARDRQRRL
jgi:hypothetical protein